MPDNKIDHAVNSRHIDAKAWKIDRPRQHTDIRMAENANCAAENHKNQAYENSDEIPVFPRPNGGTP